MLAYDASVSSAETFADVLAAKETYAAGFALRGLQARAAKGLAVLTCIDSRIEPLAMLGLRPGDAKILRNAGARATDDVLRTLVLASYLLGVDRAMVIAHTDCRMATGSEDDVHAAVREAGGQTPAASRSWSRAISRQRSAPTSSASGRGLTSPASAWVDSCTTSTPAVRDRCRAARDIASPSGTDLASRARGSR
jgi:carbonic anhydrase